MAWTKTARAKYRRSTERFESDLTDAEWAQLLPLLPARSRLGRSRQVDLCEVVNALLYQLWKYTEKYAAGKDLRYSNSKRKTDRLAIYRPSLEDDGCQIVLGDLPPEALFFDPFDQLMRQQLLCSAIERHREMGAEIVSLMHIAPVANRELISRVTSPGLRSAGSDIHEIWSGLVRPGRFRGFHVEDVLRLACEHAPDRDWARYMSRRYGGMQ